jgi:hypothetical protein
LEQPPFPSETIVVSSVDAWVYATSVIAKAKAILIIPVAILMLYNLGWDVL